MSVLKIAALGLKRAVVLGQNGRGLQSGRDFIRFASTLYYTKRHEWVKVEDGRGIVGISDYAQESLGDVVYAQLPEADDEVESGLDCGALESVKAASELYSPVSGLVLEKNEAVENAPALINSSPMEDGWLFKVQLGDKFEAEKADLLSEDEYKEFLKEEAGKEEH